MLQLPARCVSACSIGDGIAEYTADPDCVDTVEGVRGSIPVILNVYHLNEVWQQVNDKVSKGFFGIGGAFHAGIEVHGVEWSYGSDGILRGEPRTQEVHVFHRSIPIGLTDKSPEEVAILIQAMQSAWMPEDYDILDHNCCNFSDALCRELTDDPIPDWVLRFPQIAARAAAHLESVIDVKRLLQDADVVEGDASPKIFGRLL